MNHFGHISVNPGTWPLENSTEENATGNILRFVVDLKLPGVSATRKPAKDYATLFTNGKGPSGRYCFTLESADGRTCEVQMPGVPLAEVRYLWTPRDQVRFA